MHASLLEHSGSNAWIDDAVDGASIPAGTPISVISQAFARGSVSGVLPSVDGTPIEFDLVDPADRQHSFRASTGAEVWDPLSTSEMGSGRKRSTVWAKSYASTLRKIGMAT